MMNYSNFTKDNFECPGDSDIVRTVKVMSIMLLAGFGVFGNVLVIVIAVKYTRQTNIHHSIINMAVSNTLAIFLYTLEQTVNIIDNYHSLMLSDFGNACNVRKSLLFLLSTSSNVSLLTLVIISIERYRATRVTALRLRPYTKRQRVTTVTCSWGLSMAYSSYNFFVIEVQLKNGIYSCEYVPQSTAYPIASLTGCTSVIFSFFLVLFLSILTSLRLRRPSVVQANLSDIQRQVRAKRISNAVRMVVCSILLYGFCFLPSILGLAYSLEISINGFSSEIFGLGCNVSELSFVSGVLIILNSCLSPYIYIIFLPEFRETAKRLLFSKEQHVHQPSLELCTIKETQGINNQLSREK